MTGKKTQIALLWLVVFLPFAVKALDCGECHRRISGEYVQLNGKAYCSRDCALETLPKCSVCNKPCEQKFTFNNRDFCSRECVQRVFKCAICETGLESGCTVTNAFGTELTVCMECRNLPPCYYCSMPDNRRALSDGRSICRTCRRSVVRSKAEVQRIFNQVRRELSRLYGYNNTHQIELEIVDLRGLQQATPGDQHTGGNQLGLMSYQRREEVREYSDGRQTRQVVEEKCRIYLISYMPRAVLINTIVHELTHDYIRHRIGEVQDKVSEEGFCELVASLYNIRIGNAYLNRGKENSPDPVYGGGYRRMRAVYRRNNNNLLRTLRSVR